ncbi:MULTISPECIES: TetR/AcrR family transcriptional regulator [unclassified Streptomyces]|jgi:AcrR family transcriptional regulator|uniref:TetR/AcrR family transcriptional regulator n=1 Tax=unclassified Streptomyces TaxID=2593676 RepID=UPI00081B6C7E|nr:MULTISPECIES: TetR/AcrR family transcriptional regulator [unclassified Streptomyces]MYQ82345.1 TetR family transcriptional regulator [Streptomyces sp. SID4936]SCD35078.1 transcriptional regulator, TetR family [Streptomyces sp. DvalAA-43]
MDTRRVDEGPDAAKPRPLRRDAELNRRRILRAGREVFAARGLQATLNDVAHHAGLGVGTVYRRYPDKQALAEAVFAEELDEIAAMAQEALAEGDAFAALAGFLEKSLERATYNRGLRELMRHGTLEGTGLARARGEIASRCERLVARAHAQGVLRDGVTGADVVPIAAMIDAVMDLSTERPGEMWRRYLAIILDGLRARPDQAPLRDAGGTG